MKKSRLLACCVGLTILVAAVLSASAQQDQVVSSNRHDDRTIPHLTVSGNAELKKPADQLNLSLGVTSQSQEAQTAIDENSRTMQAVVATLEQVGLTKAEYKTGRFQVTPMYSQHPARGAPENWQPKITGYHVLNTLEIKTKKIDKTGKIIQAATEAGANMVDSIWFDLADMRKHRGEAIAEATANARADATALSGAAGVRLLRVLSITLDNAMPQPMYATRGMQGDMAMEGAGMSSAEPPIEPGDISVHANVTIVYEIAPAQ